MTKIKGDIIMNKILLIDRIDPSDLSSTKTRFFYDWWYGYTFN